MRRVAVGIFIVVAIATALAYGLRGDLAVRLMERVVAANMGTSIMDDLPDGLHVALCGAGGPFPDPARSGPCVAVIAGGGLFVVDAGTGGARSLTRMRIPPGRVDAVLLTHFHSDHIDGLGELLMLRWVGGTHEAPTPVHGPPGVERVVEGLAAAYAQDSTYRVAHHGTKTVPPGGAGGLALPFPVPAVGQGHVVLEADGLVVTAFRVEHPPIEPAIGYRFDYAGRSVVVSGDTKKSANLERIASGVDILVHEALSPRLLGILNRAAANAGVANLEKITRDVLDYHTTPVEAAEVARDAGARHLVYYHVVPPVLLAPLEDVFLEGVEAVYDGPVTLGRDGSFFSLPAGSDSIEARDLL